MATKKKTLLERIRQLSGELEGELEAGSPVTFQGIPCFYLGTEVSKLSGKTKYVVGFKDHRGWAATYLDDDNARATAKSLGVRYCLRFDSPDKFIKVG